MAILLVLLAVLFCYTSPAMGETYWVKGSVGASASCAASSGTSDPGGSNYLKTVPDGLSCLAAGDTLMIHAGTYTAAIQSTAIPSGISDTQRTNIFGVAGAAVILQPAANSIGDSISLLNRSYITFDNIIIDGTSATALVVRLGGTAPHAHYITFQNGQIRNGLTTGSLGSSVGTCVSFGGSGGTSSHITFRNLEIYNCGVNAVDPSKVHGLYLTASDSLIERCNIHDNSGHGIHNYSGTGNASNNIIRYNRVHDNGSRGILIGSGSGNVAHHNVVYRNGDAFAASGIATGFNATNNAIYNNTIYDNNAACVEVRSGSTGTLVKNNICRNNGTNPTNGGSGTVFDNNACVTAGTGCEIINTGDPFVNAAAGDFQLVSTATWLINAGVALAGYSFNGSALEIGAFETFVPSGAVVEAATPNTVAITFQNNVFPPLLPATGCTGFSFAGITGNPTISSCLRTGQNTLTFVLSGNVASGNTVTWAYSGGTVTDSALLGMSANQPLFALSAQPVTNNVTGGGPTPEIVQTHYAFFQLYGPEATPTPFTYQPTIATDSPVTMPPTAAFRLRVKVKGQLDDPPATNLRLFHDREGAGYSAVQSTTTNGIRAYGTSGDATIPSHGSMTTQDLLTSEVANVACSLIRDTSVIGVDLGLNTETECEWVLQLDDTIDQTHSFRVYTEAGTELSGGYPVTPSLVTRAPFAASTQ